MSRKIEKTFEELDESLGEILAGIDNNSVYTEVDRVFAHKKAKLHAENYILKKAETLGETNVEFGEMFDDIWNAKAMTLDSKTDILIELYGYYITGEFEKMRELYGKLFNPDRKATYLPSE